jgi:hypothetical protein
MILDGTILNADINASAAIAGTKISPNFGSQNVVTTGTVTAASLIPTGSSVPTNGVYLPAANSVGISTNGTGRVFVDNAGRFLLEATSTSASCRTIIQGNSGANNIGIAKIASSTATPGSTETLGRLEFTDSGHSGAVLLAANRDGGTWTTSSSQPSRFTISTTPDAASTAVERLRISSAGTTTLTSAAATAPFIATIGSSEVARIDSSGRLGLGTSSPSQLLHVAGNSNSATFAGQLIGDANERVRIGYKTGGPDTGLVCAQIIQDSNVLHIASRDTTNGAIIFNVGAAVAERARIDSSGRLLIGTSTSRSQAGINGQSQIEGTTAGGSTLQIVCNTNDNSGAFVTLGSTRGTTIGATTVVNNGDRMGEIRFAGSDGTSQIQGALIIAAVDGPPGTDDMPGRLVFSVTADGSASPTEALRISSNRAITVSDGGNVVLGTTTGTKIGTATSQKIGFYNATPVVQPTTGVAEAAFVENSGGTAVNVDSTFGGYTIQQVVEALQTLGLLA